MQSQRISNHLYMTTMEDRFFDRVFNYDRKWASACKGFVSAHGDKVEQYREYWEGFGLNFNRASMIYLLTYTDLLGEVPKSHSKEWVKENYDTYAAMLVDLEDELASPSGRWAGAKMYREVMWPLLVEEVFKGDHKSIERYRYLYQHEEKHSIIFDRFERFHPKAHVNNMHLMVLLCNTKVRTGQHAWNYYVWIEKEGAKYFELIDELERKYWL